MKRPDPTVEWKDVGVERFTPWIGDVPLPPNSGKANFLALFLDGERVARLVVVPSARQMKRRMRRMERGELRHWHRCRRIEETASQLGRAE